jgi:hypothetical protein
MLSRLLRNWLGGLPTTALCCLVGVSVLSCVARTTAGPLFTASEPRPADASLLFDGRDTSQWVKAGTSEPVPWKVQKGCMEVRGGSICTKRAFSDIQLHVEFWLPLMADARGQGRSNSGVYVAPWCEIQVLDSYGLKSQNNDCGAVYGQYAPIVNACRPPEQWQTYDAVFHAARYENGKKVANARITVFQNGVLIQDNAEVTFSPDTAPSPGAKKSADQLLLQDHGNAVRYRNIWVREL